MENSVLELIQSFFADGATKFQLKAADFVVEEQPSSLVIINGKLTVPAGKFIPEGEYHVSWRPNGRVVAFNGPVEVSKEVRSLVIEAFQIYPKW